MTEPDRCGDDLGELPSRPPKTQITDGGADAFFRVLLNSSPPSLLEIHVCECEHDRSEHPWRGSCRGIDSYGIRCTCPSYLQVPDDEDGGDDD